MERGYPETFRPRDLAARVSSAFTLIELLAVVATTGVLASLFFPTLSTAKTKARTTVCKNHLRQLGLAMSMYVGDNETFPAYFQPGPLGTGENLLTLLSGYLGKSLTNDNPGQAIKSHDSFAGPPYHCTEKAQWFRRNYDYGYNVSGVDLSQGGTNRLGLDGGIRGGVKDGAVQAPSEMIGMIDTLGYSDGGPGPIMPAGPYTFAESKGFRASVGSQHSGRGNVLFCDLHLEFDRPERWRASSESARRRWNSDNEPHRNLWP
jgi:prepilin-type processing-associated H-X9-DG protein